MILFGAMKKGNKSKLKTGTVGKLSPLPKHPELTLTLMRLKDEPDVEEDEAVEEEEKDTKGSEKKK